MKVKQKTKYWYKITTYYCPLCGGTQNYRTRTYTPKPDSHWDRHEEHEVWDYCGVL